MASDYTIFIGPVLGFLLGLSSIYFKDIYDNSQQRKKDKKILSFIVRKIKSINIANPLTEWEHTEPEPYPKTTLDLKPDLLHIVGLESVIASGYLKADKYMQTRRHLFSILILFFLFPFSTPGKGISLDWNKTDTFANIYDCRNYEVHFITNYHEYYEANARRVFKNYAFFDSSIFLNTVCFSNSIFESEVNFNTSCFDSIAVFKEVRFADKISFREAIFNDQCKLGSSYYVGEANFTNTRFHSFADFSYSSFENEVSFRFAEFDKLLDLSLLKTTQNTQFDFFQCHLPWLIDFSNNSSIANVADFMFANFNDDEPSENCAPHYINIHETDASKVKIDYDHFRLCFFDNQKEDAGMGKLLSGFPVPYTDSVMHYLENTRAFREYINDVFPFQDISSKSVRYFLDYSKQFKMPRRLSPDEKAAIYELALKNFSDNGQKESYKLLDIEYHNYKYGKWSLGNLWNCYGYQKGRVFLWAILFLLLFSFVSFLKLNNFNGYDLDAPGLSEDPVQRARNGIYCMEGIPLTYPPGRLPKKSKSKELFRRTWYSIIYTASLFFLFKLKMENLNFKRGWIVFIIIVYIVGIVHLAYMANFVFQK